MIRLALFLLTLSAYGQPVTPPVHLTGPGNNIEYSSVTAFSATSKYVMTSDLDSAVNIYDRASGKLVYISVPQVNIAYAWWDPKNNEKIWYVYGAQIFSRILNTGVVTLVADLSKPAGNRPAMPDLQQGNGTGDVTQDGYLAIMSRQARTLCAVNITGLTPANQESHIRCASYDSGGMSDVNYVDMAKLDSVSKKHYLLASAVPSSVVFSIGAKGLDVEYALPSGPFDYGITPHSAIGSTPDGQAFVVWSRYNTANRYDVVAAFFNKGAKLMDSAVYLYPSNLGGSGAHFGATAKGVIVHSIYDAVPDMPVDPLRNSIIVTEWGKKPRIIANHGSNAMADYWATPRASISRDGKYVAYVSNMGAKKPASVYVVPTTAKPPTTAQRLTDDQVESR